MQKEMGKRKSRDYSSSSSEEDLEKRLKRLEKILKRSKKKSRKHRRKRRRHSRTSSPRASRSSSKERSFEEANGSKSDKTDEGDKDKRAGSDSSHRRSPRDSLARNSRESSLESRQGSRSGTPPVQKTSNDATSGAAGDDPNQSGTQQRSVQATGDAQLNSNVHTTPKNTTDNNNTELKEASSSREPFKELDVNILQALGKRLTADKILAAPVHKDVEVRWKEIYEKGLPKEERDEIFKKYSQAENCAFINAPKLNPEVKACLSEPVTSRDSRMVAKQEKVAICLAALGSHLAELIKVEKVENLSQINLISDCCRMLVDLQRDESLTRKSLIIQNINPSMKDMLNATVINEWLFGSQLEEKLKAAKLLERSSKDLKIQPKNPPKRQTKNWNYPPRQTRKPSNHQRSRQGSGSSKPRQPQSHYKPQSTPDESKTQKKKI